MRKALLVLVGLFIVVAVFFALRSSGIGEGPVALPANTWVDIPEAAWPGIGEQQRETRAKCDYPYTPTTPVLLHDWTFSVGDYSFGAVDCATEHMDGVVTEHATVLCFGSSSTLTRFRLESLGILATTLVLVVACMVWFWPGSSGARASLSR